MTVTETKLKGCFILEPKLFNDDRGYFFESFNEDVFNKATGANTHFVQDNQSYSAKGVIRGIHYQTGNAAQAKLVRVIKGAVLDVAVDLRQQSATFGQFVAIELSAENKKQLFIPRGFGHGFAVISDVAEFFYKCDNYYNKEAEAGILYNDTNLNIDWKISVDNSIVSQKDKELPKFKDAHYF